MVLTKSTQGTRSTWIMKNKFEIYDNNKNGWHKKHIGHCACCMLQLSLKTQVNHKHLKMLTIFWKNLLSQSTMTRAHTYDTMVLFQPHNEPYLFQHLGWAYARGAQASSFSGTSTGTLRKPDQTSSVSSFSWEQSAFEWWQCLSWGSTPKGRQKSRWRPRFVGFQVFLNRYSLRFVVVEKIYFLSQKCWKSVLTSLWTVLL